jgi:hypothetical protein
VRFDRNYRDLAIAWEAEVPTLVYITARIHDQIADSGFDFDRPTIIRHLPAVRR